MPAEWSPHEWLWIGFPGDPVEWPVGLQSAQQQVANFANAVHMNATGKGERVILVTRTEADAETARTLVRSDIEVVVRHFGDIWLRDTGPIGVLSDIDRTLIGLGFNGWGGKYDMAGDQDIAARLADDTTVPFCEYDFICEGGAIETDGTGLFMSTEQCLLSGNRNDTLGRHEIERRLEDALGLVDMVWLGDGLVNDHTDGHVDNLARFLAPGLIGIPQATQGDDPNGAIFADAAARAKAEGLNVAPLPSVGRYLLDGAIAPASYMNFLIGNATVVVPQYGAANDAAALDALAPFFPDRAIVGITSDALLRGGGSFHCCSQQFPAAGAGI